MAKQVEKKKQKRPTAEKRMVQNEKKRIQNKAFKSSVRTAIKKFESMVEARQAEEIKSSLNEVFSLVDKAVKKGVYKLNKASRTKSRLTAKAAAA